MYVARPNFFWILCVFPIHAQFNVYMEKQDQIDTCEQDVYYNDWERQKAKLMKRKSVENYTIPSWAEVFNKKNGPRPCS